MGSPFNNPSEELDFSFTPTAPVVHAPLDFSEDKKEPIEPNPIDPLVKEPVVTTPTSPSTTVNSDSGINIDDIPDNDKTVEFTANEEPPIPEGLDYLAVINKLSEVGIIEEGYEDFDPNADPNEDVLIKLIQHNSNKARENALEEFIGELSPFTQRILSFDLTSKGQNVENYLKTLLNENSIKSLNVENEYDREKIVRTYYEDENWTAEELEEKIADLKQVGLLEKEARKLKPKLDEKAEKIAKSQEEAEQGLRQVENGRKQYYFGRLNEALQKGTVEGVRLNKEDAERVAQLLLVEDVPIQLPEGRTVKMSFLESEIFRHKYSKNGSIETLILAGLLLTNKEKFMQEFSKIAKTEATKEFVNGHKYNIAAKAGLNNTSQEQKTPQSPKKDIPWNFKTNK